MLPKFVSFIIGQSTTAIVAACELCELDELDELCCEDVQANNAIDIRAATNNAMILFTVPPFPKGKLQPSNHSCSANLSLLIQNDSLPIVSFIMQKQSERRKKYRDDGNDCTCFRGYRMSDRAMLYSIIYALVALDGRAETLFGDGASLAYEAFTRSGMGKKFPELWFELPLLGRPWFDLHVLVAQGDFEPGTTFTPETSGNNPEAFAWFANQKNYVRQLALSWDVSSGDIEQPAVQLLLRTNSAQTTCGFLSAVGRDDATDSYRAFLKKLPPDWFACYTGVFPRRTVPFLRIECTINRSIQDAYAKDISILEKHLRQVGLTNLDGTILPWCHVLAKSSFDLEFQFDVDPTGCASTTFSASVRFQAPIEESATKSFDPYGEAGKLMKRIEQWGLADDRWQLLSDTIVSQKVTRKGKSSSLYCYPAFIKLRWKNGEPLDAKTYLIAGAQED